MREFCIPIYQGLRVATQLCVLSYFISINASGAGVQLSDDEPGSIPDYNLKIGEAYFDSIFRSGVGWDSNFNQDAAANGSAFYSVGLLTNLTWVPSPRISLKTDIDLQYIQAPDDAGGGRLLISGGVDKSAASMSLDIRSGDRVVTVNAELSSSLSGLRVEDSTGQQQNRSFQELVYSVGADYERALSPNLTSTLGYEFSSQQAIGSQTEDELASILNADSHEAVFELALDVTNSLRTGLYAGSKLTNFGDESSSLIRTYDVGLVGTYLSTYAVIFGLNVGAVYQRNSGGFYHSDAGWSPDLEFSAEFSSSSTVKHKFTVNHQRNLANLVTDSGVYNPDLSQFSQVTSVGYEIRLDLNPSWQVFARQGLSQVDDVGSSASQREYSFNLKTDYVISPRWLLSFNYDYTNLFDAGVKGEGDSRHVVSSSLSFKL
jgi:hypothetical protein